MFVSFFLFLYNDIKNVNGLSEGVFCATPAVKCPGQSG